MPCSCTVAGCGSNTKRDKVKLFGIPFENSEGDVEKARREKWINFVSQGKGRQWKPTKNTKVCNKHFTPESFENRYDKKLFLERDEVGISAIPTLRDESVTARVTKVKPVVNKVVPKSRRERVNAISNRLLERAAVKDSEPPPVAVSIIVKDYHVETNTSSTQTDEIMPSLAAHINSILDRVLNTQQEVNTDTVRDTISTSLNSKSNNKQSLTYKTVPCNCKCACSNKENLSSSNKNPMTSTNNMKDSLLPNTDKNANTTSTDTIRESILSNSEKDSNTSLTSTMINTSSSNANSADTQTAHANTCHLKKTQYPNSKTMTDDNIIFSMSSKTMKLRAVQLVTDVNKCGVEVKNASMQTTHKECKSCRNLQRRNRRFSNRIINYRSKHSENKKLIKSLQMEIEMLKKQLSQQSPTNKNTRKTRGRPKGKYKTKTTNSATSSGRKTRRSEAPTTHCKVYYPSTKKQKTDSATNTESNGIKVIVR